MPKTILLADDSVTIQKVVGISFANEDVVLLTVDNGDDAVARAREARPDLVLADIAMPGLDGYAVCEAIKTDPALRHVPVLLLSGTFETFDDERAREVGADGHITKPFEAQALVDRVNDLLARAEAERPVGGAATTVLVSEPPSAADAFEFFDDEFAAPEPTPAPPSAAAATMLLADEPEIPIVPVAADPLELETTAESALDLPGDEPEPITAMRFEDDAPPPDAHATLLFDGADSRVPPVPADAAAFAETRGSRTPLVAEPPLASRAATQILPDDEDADALEFPFEPEDPIASAGPLRDTAATEPSLAAAPASHDDASEDLFASEIEPEPSPPPAAVAAAGGSRTAPTASGASGAQLDALRGELRAHLEKVAWEAFGDLSERIVRETVARVEAVAWEVIPQMAEALIREEIRKLQADE